MTDIRKLLGKLAQQEEALRETEFLAPCLRGGAVRTRVAGLVRTFRPEPGDFEGWGIFRPAGEKAAGLVEEAGLPLVAEYLKLLKPLRVRLAHALQRQTWLAYPANESDARQRFRAAHPLVVHLVSEGAPFEQVVARWDGASWWFDDLDRRADPIAAEHLREALRAVTPPEELRFKGITPEMRVAYDLAAQQAKEFFAMIQRRRDEGRLRGALGMGAGELRDFRDRGDYWQVEWTTRDGERHTSAIAKGDLTVVTAGICLAGRDRDFDLQSLVGVVERREDVGAQPLMNRSSTFHHEQLFRKPEVMRRIRELPVTVCGAGALGANIAESLARQGFGRLKVIDRDRIEERNLSTQPYHRSDIGAFKAKILANSLYRALGLAVEAQATELSAANAVKLLAGSGLVLDTFDNSVARQAVRDACAATGLPCLHAGLAGDYAEVIWNEMYRVPSATQDDVCDYPLARNLVTLAVAITCETVVAFAATGEQQSFTATLGDFAVRPFEL